MSLPLVLFNPQIGPLSGATMPGQSGPGIDGNEGVLCIPQSSSITGNLTIGLFSVISWTLIGGGLTPLQRFSWCILQPQPTGQSLFHIPYIHSVFHIPYIHSSLSFEDLIFNRPVTWSCRICSLHLWWFILWDHTYYLIVLLNMIVYPATFWDLNLDLLQLEIVGLSVGLGQA